MTHTRRERPSTLLRAARLWTHSTVAVVAAAVLVLGGGGTAMAWWAISATLSGSASASVLAPPTGLVCAETGLLNIRLTWNANTQTLPPGAIRQYAVVKVGAGGVTTDISAADTTTTRTIAPAAITADGTTALAVQTRVVFPDTPAVPGAPGAPAITGATWTSLSSGSVGVDRNWLFVYYLDCA